MGVGISPFVRVHNLKQHHRMDLDSQVKRHFVWNETRTRRSPLRALPYQPQPN